MKKPVNEIERVRGFYSRGDFWDDSVRVVLDFLGSLPDEFEIVPEGHVCVKWPEGLTRENLLRLADTNLHGMNPMGMAVALRSIAAIAPEAPKKRMVNLWVYNQDMDNGKAYMRDLDWVPLGGKIGDRWRKVGGPIEIED